MLDKHAWFQKMKLTDVVDHQIFFSATVRFPFVVLNAKSWVDREPRSHSGSSTSVTVTWLICIHKPHQRRVILKKLSKRLSAV